MTYPQTCKQTTEFARHFAIDLGARRTRRVVRQVALTAPSRFSRLFAPSRGRPPTSRHATTRTKHCNLHAIVQHRSLRRVIRQVALTAPSRFRRLFGTVAVQAANQQTRQQGHKTLQFAGKCAKPARSCRLGRGIRQVALTAPSRFLAPLWNCRPGSIRLTCPQTCTNRRNLHDIWPVSFARIACGTPSDKRHSQHPHAFGASWKCRSAGRQPPDKQQLAQNTAIYMQLCSIPCCEHIAWQVALTAPSRFSAPLWNCRPGRF